MNDDDVRRSKLTSGLRVVTEALPTARSVTIGAWVGSGARDEAPAQSGASHFLEHLLFKGTDDRSAREIAEAVESVGGEMNAFTTHEQTVFYVRVPDTRLELAVDILADVLWSPAFRPDDVDSERQVILEEIGMRDDTPDDLVHDLFIARRTSPTTRSVARCSATNRRSRGCRATASPVPPRALRAGQHRARRGRQPHPRTRRRADRAAHARLDARPSGARALRAARRRRALAVVHRPTEQAHVVLGLRSVPTLDPDRDALTVVNQALGGGMASRLFQEVREQRGLAYSVYSYRAAFDDSGFLAVYAGTAPERVQETLDVIETELSQARPRRSPGRGARRGEGPSHRLDRDVARDVGQPHAPPRAVRARGG